MKTFTKYINSKSAVLLFSIVFLAITHVFAAKDSYPSSISAQPVTASYCQSAAATALSVTLGSTTCGASGGVTAVDRTFTWYQTSTSCSGGSVVQTATNKLATNSYTPPTGTVGVLYYYCVISWAAGPVCAPSGSLTSTCATITVVTAPTTSAAGPDQNLAACATTATLAGNTPAAGTGTWTCVTNCTGVSITTPSSPSSGVTGLSPGTATTFRWTIANSPCTNSTDDVIITAVVGAGCWSYCAQNATSALDEDILNVTFGTLNNSSTCATTGGTGSVQSRYSNYTGIAAPSLVQGETVSFSIEVGTCGSNYANAVKFFIDYNNDGDLIDAGEEVYEEAATTTGPHTVTGTFVVPVGATLGNTRLRVLVDEASIATVQGLGPCTNYSWGETEDYTVNIIAPGPMSYTSCTVAQPNTTTVVKGSVNQEIIRIEIVTSGTSSPLSATSFSLSTTGSSSATGDISIARLFYTGISSTFATTTQVGNTYYDPPAGAFTITTSQTLSSGTNYFWLTYNIKSTATTSNVLDARCTSIDVGSARTPTTTSPAGTRSIVANSVGSYCTPSGTSADRYLKNVSFNSINNPTTGTTGTYNDFTSTSTNLYIGNTYDLVVEANTSDGMFAYNTYISVWIDWNADGDFGDSGEDVFAGGPSPGVGGVYRIEANISIPGGTLLGTTRMRVIEAGAVPTACGASQTGGEIEDYSIVIGELSPMTYVSCTSTQSNTTSVGAGSFTQVIIGAQVVVTGTVNPLNVSSFTFNTSGTGSTADIANAKFWTTGTSATFATTTQIGSTVAAPSGNVVFSGFTSTLLEGTNYFWMTYDVACAATSPRVVDATCNIIRVSGSDKTPATTAPAGSRAIVTATSMAYISSTTTQYTANVAKGETNQHIIGVEIVVDGCSSPISTGDFTLYNSSFTPANFTNARIYYTGASNSFSTTSLVGGPYATPPAANYTISTSTTLLSGTNYFWVTYDVSASADCGTGKNADARCSTVVVGGVTRTPTMINPAGGREVNCGVPYYSKGSLNANDLSSWSLTRDGTGASPATFNTGYDLYVQNGHSMTTSAAVTIPHLYLEYGSRVTASFLITMTDLMINNGAIFEQTFSAKSPTYTSDYIGNFYIRDGGTWIHNNNGLLPGLNRFFDANSNQWFYDQGGGTYPSGTSWGNVLKDLKTIGNFDMQNVWTTIQGNMEWRRNGSNNYKCDGATETINVGGNFIFSGGWFAGTCGVVGGADIVTWNITGDLIISAGTLQDWKDGNSGSGSILNVGGNVTITGGTLTYNNSPTGVSVINLTGGTPSVTWTQTGGTVTLCNTNIKNLKTVTLAGSQMGSVATSRTLTVETGGTLMCSNYPITGAGAFTMQDNSVLGIGSAAGIVSAGASGNVQVTGTRTYHSGGHYIYYEGLTPQVTGAFTTSPTASTVRKLRIQKSTISDIVNLSANLSVSDSTVLTRGEFGLNQKTLTITRSANDGIKRTDGYIKSEHLAAVNLSVLTWNFGATNASYTIPFGVSSAADGYIPLTFIKTAGTSNVSFSTRATLTTLNTDWAGASNVAAVTDMNRFGVDASATSVVDRWWDITASATTTADLTFTYRGVENTIDPAYQAGTLAAQHWNGSIWELKVGSGTGVTSNTGTVTVTGSDDFSPWILVADPAPLPIELLTFNASVEGEYVRLEWATASEENANHFIVKKGADPKNLEKEVVRVKAVGNSTKVVSYFEFDKNPNSGINYYQLQMVDNNGDVEKHKIVSIFFTKSFRVNSILPNPVMNQANVSVYNPDEPMNVTLEVVNNTGEVVSHESVKINNGNSIIPVDLSKFNKGLYFIKVIPRNYPSEIKKLIKQ